MLKERSTIYVQVPSPLWGEIETEGREEREREGEGTEKEMGAGGREGEWGGHAHWDSSEHISSTQRRCLEWCFQQWGQ